jgi:hypothetical protein
VKSGNRDAKYFLARIGWPPGPNAAQRRPSARWICLTEVSGELDFDPYLFRDSRGRECPARRCSPKRRRIR